MFCFIWLYLCYSDSFMYICFFIQTYLVSYVFWFLMLSLFLFELWSIFSLFQFHKFLMMSYDVIMSITIFHDFTITFCWILMITQNTTASPFEGQVMSMIWLLNFLNFAFTSGLAIKSAIIYLVGQYSTFTSFLSIKLVM